MTLDMSLSVSLRPICISASMSSESSVGMRDSLRPLAGSDLCAADRDDDAGTAVEVCVDGLSEMWCDDNCDVGRDGGFESVGTSPVRSDVCADGACDAGVDAGEASITDDDDDDAADCKLSGGTSSGRLTNDGTRSNVFC